MYATPHSKAPDAEVVAELERIVASADFGKADAATRAFKEALAKVSFEGLNAGRDRGLGEEKGLGGPAKALLIGDVYKRL